ncbi:MAG: DUF1565 domain-containing protein [Gammaproteobacteria bacterium]|nr:DUF1565 domain-containing protein [Gammaproteobacteria bacterium]
MADDSKIRRRTIFLVLCLSLSSLSAAVYYVDGEHTGSSDANSGTKAAPWSTIQHAVSSTAPGDSVYVKNGTYNEQVRFDRSGTAGNDITVAAYETQGATIDGNGVSVPPYSGLVDIAGRGYVRFSGFRVINSGPGGTATGIQVEGSNNVVVAKNYTFNTASSGILVWGSSSILISGNEVEKALSAGSVSENEAITVGETNGFEIRNNYVHDGHSIRGEGIDAKDGSRNGLIHNNHVHHMQGVGIYVDAWDKATGSIDVYENLVHDIAGGGVSIGSERGGVLDDIRVYNNIIYDNKWLGIDLHACCIQQHPVSNVQIVNNTVVDNGKGQWGGGIYVENPKATGVVIRNNILSGNLSFQIALEGTPPADAAIDHNLINEFRNGEGETYGSAYQTGDPKFLDATRRDFRLTAGSPAIDNGTDVSFLSADYDGNSRPRVQGYDIGAFEAASAGGGGNTLGMLESPSIGSKESGIGLIRGWVCDAGQIRIEIDGSVSLVASYGTERPDTLNQCGDTKNGFGMTYNWNRLGDGLHQGNRTKIIRSLGS